MFEAGVAPGIKALKVSGPLGLKKKNIDERATSATKPI
jgi:hypothetical protein